MSELDRECVDGREGVCLSEWERECVGGRDWVSGRERMSGIE